MGNNAMIRNGRLIHNPSQPRNSRVGFGWPCHESAKDVVYLDCDVVILMSSDTLLHVKIRMHGTTTLAR